MVLKNIVNIKFDDFASEVICYCFGTLCFLYFIMWNFKSPQNWNNEGYFKVVFKCVRLEISYLHLYLLPTKLI